MLRTLIKALTSSSSGTTSTSLTAKLASISAIFGSGWVTFIQTAPVPERIAAIITGGAVAIVWLGLEFWSARTVDKTAVAASNGAHPPATAPAPLMDTVAEEVARALGVPPQFVHDTLAAMSPKANTQASPAAPAGKATP